MFQPTHPGVHVARATRVPSVPVRMDVAGFVGIAARGPLGQVVIIDGWPDFVAAFGDFQDNAYLAYAVRGFFDNGGTRCHVLRVAAPALNSQTSGAQPLDGASSLLADTARIRPGAVATLVQSSEALTDGAQPAERLASIVSTVSGFMPGNLAILKQSGARPVERLIAAVDLATRTLSWDQPVAADFDLTRPIAIASTAMDERLVASVAGAVVTWARPLDARFDLTKTIRVGLGAGAAATLVPDQNGEPLLSISARNPGRWGNGLSVRVTTGFAGDYLSRVRPVPDPTDVLSLDRVDGLAAGSFVLLSQDGAADMRTIVRGVDAATLSVQFNDSMAGFDMALAADGTRPILLRRHVFALSVSENGRLVETHENLDLPPPDAPTQSSVNTASRLIEVALMPGLTDRWIDAQGPSLARGVAVLAGGRDGTAMLRPVDFTGSQDMARSGLRLFENHDEPAALAMPDITLLAQPARATLTPEVQGPDPCALCPDPLDMPPPATPDVLVEATPGFAQPDIEAIQQRLVEHCAVRGDRVAVLDMPLSEAGECLDWPDMIRWRQRFDSSYAVTYFPWIDVADPLDQGGRLLRRVPPSGHVLGQFARVDDDPGRAAPANQPLDWTAATACTVDDTRHAMLNEQGINAITLRPGRGIRIMGARTLSRHPDWVQLTVRRLFIRLKRTFRSELAWAVFEPANRAFEQRIIATLEGLLELEWQAGRLRGESADEAFQVVINRDAAAVDNGEFVVLIGIAPAMPAEFVLLRLTFTLDAMDLAELTGAGGWPA
ncbi:phage tail sheath family protein [Tateyamaria sp.]|uniref:phage tail sheath family protein n=1 Tax=Tateyamaria sp. TaxID=1929288 RepID=UPI003B21D219